MNAEEVIKTVCEHFKLTEKQITKRCRMRRYVVPRHICMYFLYNNTGTSLAHIGELMGGYDHTTVINARNVCENAKEVFDKVYYPHIEALQQKFGVPLDDYQKLQAENKHLQNQVLYWQRKAKAKKTIVKQLTPDVKDVKFQRPPAVYSNQRAS